MARAVHRLDGVDALVGRLRREHVLAELLPVARRLPEATVHELGAVDLVEASGLLLVAHVGDERLEHAPTLRVPEHRARCLLLHVEEIELAADLAVVALLGLFEADEVVLEVLLARPRRAVDALQHLVARIAAPIGAGDLHQLEHFQLAGGRHVRTAAEVDPAALPVQADRLVRGDAGDDLGLVVLAETLEERDRLVARHLAARHRQVGLRELGHLRFDGGEVLGRERPLVGEIVVEAVLDDGTDGHLRFREQRLGRLREQVRRRVADDLERVGVLVGDDLERSVLRDRERGVDQLAADLAREGGLGEPGPDAGGDLRHRDGLVVGPLAAVGQRDHRHGVRTPRKMVGASGIEPPTTTMSRWCSTTELRACRKAAKDTPTGPLAATALRPRLNPLGTPADQAPPASAGRSRRAAAPPARTRGSGHA